jgi:hypothetical protein
MSDHFASSSEFKNKYGPLTDPEDFVERVYLNVLGRSADSVGLQYWSSRIAQNSITRSGLMRQFAYSSEGRTKAMPMTDAVNVVLGLLKRLPSATEIASGRSARGHLSVALASEAYGALVGASMPVKPVYSFDQLFMRFDKPYGVVTGDGGFAAPLSDGRVVWGTQDGMLAHLTGNWGEGDRSASAPRGISPGYDTTFRDNYRNALIITRPGTNEFETVGAPTMRSNGRFGFFAPDDFAPALPPGHVYWGAAMVAETEAGAEKLRVILIDRKDSGSVPSQGRRIATVDTATMSIEGATGYIDTAGGVPIPRTVDGGSASGQVEWGSAILEDPSAGFTYIYSVWKEDGFLTRKMVLSRVPSGMLTNLDAWEHWSMGDQWLPTPTALKSVANRPSNSVVKTPSGYSMFFLDWESSDPALKRTVRALTSSAPTGPWLASGVPSASCVVPDDADLGLSSSPEPAGNHVSKQAIAHPGVGDVPSGNVLLSVANAVQTPQPAQNQGHGYRLRFFVFDLAASGEPCRRG